GDAVERRGLVEADERVGVEPVPAGGVAAVDEGDVDVGVVDQRVGEGHPHGTGADDDVVGLDRAHEARLLARRRAVKGARGPSAPPSWRGGDGTRTKRGTPSPRRRRVPDVRTLVREALPALGSRSRQSFRDRRPGAEYLHRRRATLMADVAAPTPRSRRPLIIGAVAVLVVVGAALVLPRLLGPSAPDVPSAAAE